MALRILVRFPCFWHVWFHNIQSFKRSWPERHLGLDPDSYSLCKQFSCMNKFSKKIHYSLFWPLNTAPKFLLVRGIIYRSRFFHLFHLKIRFCWKISTWELPNFESFTVIWFTEYCLYFILLPTLSLVFSFNSSILLSDSLEKKATAKPSNTTF